MDLNYVKKLVKLLQASGVDEIEIEEEGKRVRVSRNSNNRAQGIVAGTPAESVVVPQPVVPSSPPAPLSPTPSGSSEVTAGKKYHEITSPIVGTFYRSPAPDADPYVEIGQDVQPGTVLCIIEAMKLMNEIESDVAGRIVKIHIENGQPVEYNQTLFSIESV